MFLKCIAKNLVSILIAIAISLGLFSFSSLANEKILERIRRDREDLKKRLEQALEDLHQGRETSGDWGEAPAMRVSRLNSYYR